MTIMVVEDDGALRETVVEILSGEGFGAVGAENGSEALSLLRQQGVVPGVILLDLMMPVMNGWQFRAEQLGDPAISSIPVIVMSAMEPHDIRADALVPKPFRVEKLLATIDTVVHGNNGHAPT
jgi:CheY-like chemotaxis protein